MSIQIQAVTTLQEPILREQLISQGMILANSPRIIVIGRKVDGVVYGSCPALELVAIKDGKEPILHQVALHKSGHWMPFDGVKFIR